MKRNTLLAITCALGLGTLTGCAARVDHGGGRADKIYGFVTQRVDSALDDVAATDDQRTKVHAIKDRIFEEAVALRDDNREARKQALEEWKRDQPDAKKLHALVDARMDEVKKVMHDAVDGIVELHGVLTPEQRQKLTKLVEERMAKHDAD